MLAVSPRGSASPSQPLMIGMLQMPSDRTHSETYEAGLTVRRKVLGDEHVDRSLRQTSDFSQPVQELVTEYCWGTIWTRDGLPLQTRSLINIAMLTALGRNHELGLHIRGALRNGVTKEEIREVLLQTAIYVGVPASLESHRVAEQVFAEVDGNA
jgi:4-carboxymuconolactone decarboxylase